MLVCLVFSRVSLELNIPVQKAEACFDLSVLPLIVRGMQEIYADIRLNTLKHTDET